MHIYTYTYGYIPVEMWEYPAFLLLVGIFSMWGYRQKKIHEKDNPSYRYFLPAMGIKIFGGLAFALIYILYYGGGDTTNYYESALPFVNLFWENPGHFFQIYFGGGTAELRSLFTHDTGYPMGTYFFNDRTRSMVKLLVPVLMISGKSYFIATLWFSVLTFGGLWRLYQMFRRYFPTIDNKLAIAVLFMPSVVFWGSGIIKDSVSLTATCFFIDATNDFTLKRSTWPSKMFRMLLSAVIIIAVKPYILIVLLPGTLIWFFYTRIKQIKNKYFRTVIVPVTYAVILISSYAILTSLSSSLGKFAPEKALQTAVVTQQDLKQEYYKGNTFDIGEFDASYSSLAMKFPVATAAGLYRPFLWESNNAVMLLSGLENALIMFLTIWVIVAVKWRKLTYLIREYPIILYSLVFSVLFAFMIGITTANFGALVRFKIPLIPLYMASIMVLHSHAVKVFFRKDRDRRFFWG